MASGRCTRAPAATRVCRTRFSGPVAGTADALPLATATATATITTVTITTATATMATATMAAIATATMARMGTGTGFARDDGTDPRPLRRGRASGLLAAVGDARVRQERRLSAAQGRRADLLPIAPAGKTGCCSPGGAGACYNRSDSNLIILRASLWASRRSSPQAMALRILAILS